MSSDLVRLRRLEEFDRRELRAARLLQSAIRFAQRRARLRWREEQLEQRLELVSSDG